MNNQFKPILCNTESEFNVQDTQHNDSSDNSDNEQTTDQLANI